MGMAQNFLAFDRDQGLLLPPDLRDWLEPGHFALFVIDAVGQLDLAAFCERYGHGARGRPAYPPEVMVGLMLYAYSRGVRSSRVIERRCVEDVAFRVICANLLPDHATIARFRAEHERALEGLFGQVLAMCERAGLVRVGVIAIDSTKIAADASCAQNLGYEQIARELLADAARVDAQEDALYGEQRGDELPAELVDPKSRRERLAAAKRELEAEWEAQRAGHEAKLKRHQANRQRPIGQRVGGRPPRQRDMSGAPPGRKNLTDPDSRSVRTARGFIQGYSAQVAVGEGQVVLAAEITVGGSDRGLLGSMVEQARAQLAAIGAEEPAVVLADAGYWKQSEIKDFEDQGLTVLIPPDKDIQNPNPRLTGGAYQRMRERLKTEDGARLYAQRMRLVEPVFGQTKHNRRIDRFHRRGLDAVRSEWRMITATHNLLKLWRAALPAVG